MYPLIALGVSGCSAARAEWWTFWLFLAVLVVAGAGWALRWWRLP